jgi:hypothetical protein
MDSSLLDDGGERLAFLLSFVLFLGLVLTIGLVSRDLENAIVFTVMTTAPLFLWYVLSHFP